MQGTGAASSDIGRGARVNVGWLIAGLLTSPVLVLVSGAVRPRAAGGVAAWLAGLSFVAVLGAWVGGVSDLRVTWLHAWGLPLHLSLDGLGALYALLTTGIGCLVIVYSQAYMPGHAHDEQALVIFYALITLFMAAMVGLVVSIDLYSLLIFWDLTAIASYFLIAFDTHDRRARAAANVALVLTAGSAVLLLAAAVLLHVETGTSDLPDIFANVPSGTTLTVIGMLAACAAMAKSAQVPLHFWLPRAMVAPTPVSAYLHSAAMVAAGVFLLSRLHPLLAEDEGTRQLLIWVGMASIACGSILALAHDEMKSILAYSTVAQYGYVVWLLGIGGSEAAPAAALYVVAHALAKSALFLTAGAVTTATGEHRLSRVGGLAARVPWLAAGSAICAAGLSALPLTVGFFKDELFFRVAHGEGTLATIAAIGAAGLTFAYTWRFWCGIFYGAYRRKPRALPRRLVAPVLALAAIIIAGGLRPQWLTGLAEAGGAVIHGAPLSVETRYHVDPRASNLMALAAYGLGIVLLLGERTLRQSWRLVARAGELYGPDRIYHAARHAMATVSTDLHGIEVRDLRDRAAAVLVPGGALIGGALLAGAQGALVRVGDLRLVDLPLAAALVVSAIAAVAAVRPRRHLPMILALSMVSYSLAVAFAFFGAPDVALVALLVQTVLTLLLLAALSLFPSDHLRETARAEPRLPPRAFVVSSLATAGAFAFAWVALSWPASPAVPLADVRLTPEAHAGDAVTAILADFRGLDTLGEATVLVLALLGIATLLRWHGGGP